MLNWECPGERLWEIVGGRGRSARLDQLLEVVDGGEGHLGRLATSTHNASMRFRRPGTTERLPTIAGPGFPGSILRSDMPGSSLLLPLQRHHVCSYGYAASLSHSPSPAYRRFLMLLTTLGR